MYFTHWEKAHIQIKSYEEYRTPSMIYIAAQSTDDRYFLFRTLEENELVYDMRERIYQHKEGETIRTWILLREGPSFSKIRELARCYQDIVTEALTKSSSLQAPCRKGSTNPAIE